MNANHITVDSTECATIVGALANSLNGFHRSAQGGNHFFVYDGQTLVAAQSTREGAESYMTPERVLVEVVPASSRVEAERPANGVPIATHSPLELAAYRLPNGATHVTLVDGSEATWEAYCAEVREGRAA